MTGMTILLVLGTAGVIWAAFMAGAAEKRTRALLWCGVGVLLVMLTGGMVFLMKNAVLRIGLSKNPGMQGISHLIPEIVIPDEVMLILASWAVLAGGTVFLLAFNCRRNMEKWYWAVLWSAGIIFWLGQVIFLPHFYGIAVWMMLAGITEEGVSAEVLPVFYIMLSLWLTAAVLWTWHTLRTAKHSWKNILTFAGTFTVIISLLWLSAWGAGEWSGKKTAEKAAASGIVPYRVTESLPAELKNPEYQDFYTGHPLYSPPRSGRYDWSKGEIPDAEKEYTLKFFDSPELESHLKYLEKIAAYAGHKDVLYPAALQSLRSLVRHRADRAELYYRTGQKDKILPELLKYPEIEALIPADTPFLIQELVRTAGRNIWVMALIQYAPEDKECAPFYRQLLEWSRNWQVHLPGEAGFYLAGPEKKERAIVEFFYAPYRKTARYRRFSDAVDRIPELQKLQQQELIAGRDMYAEAAGKQRLGIVLGRTAIALKLYRAEHGEYPVELSALVPDYLDKEYVSPYNGEKLKYSVKDHSAYPGETGKKDFILSAGGVSFSSVKSPAVF